MFSVYPAGENYLAALEKSFFKGILEVVGLEPLGLVAASWLLGRGILLVEDGILVTFAQGIYTLILKQQFPPSLMKMMMSPPAVVSLYAPVFGFTYTAPFLNHFTFIFPIFLLSSFHLTPLLFLITVP
jgi:hypothetical protein